MRLKPIIFSSILSASATQGAIIAGEIMIVGYRSDTNDAISFVTWATINDGTLRDSEDVMSWTAPAGGISPGVVVSITSPSNSTASLGTTTGALDGLLNGGDQVFIGSSAFPTNGDITKPGSAYSGTLLYGFDMDEAAGWDADATNTGTSALPAALNAFGLNMSVNHEDNGQYTGPKTGLTIAEYKSAILDATNWTFEEDGPTFGSLSTTGFTIIPEPSSALIAAIGVLALLRRRR